MYWADSSQRSKRLTNVGDDSLGILEWREVATLFVSFEKQTLSILETPTTIIRAPVEHSDAARPSQHTFRSASLPVRGRRRFHPLARPIYKMECTVYIIQRTGSVP